jgi:hypothetical protein
MRISVGDPVDLTDLVGRPLTTETLTIGTNRLMDAITALESEIRGEPAPARRFVFRSGKVQGSIPVVDASLDSAAQPTTGADEEPVA